MRYFFGFGLILAGGAAAVAGLLLVDALGAAEVERRVPWTSSRIMGSPEAPLPYVATRIFPGLKFKEPVDFSRLPGSDRLFVLELAGKLFSFPSTSLLAQAELVVDLKKEIPGLSQAYGFAFHPQFSTNGYVYICYVLKEGLPDGSRVSRFRMTATDPPTIDPQSEKIMITWPSGGHNGGCLKFGPEGYLYISTGDAASPNPPDPLKTGQDISDLLSSILRIDVNQEELGKGYRVPADNPFLHIPKARPEVWAYGLRNPWRMSFDSITGALWAGDVGWELWEMIYQIERGGNYGWSLVEGPQSIRSDVVPGPTPILPPVISHSHSEAASITGGCVYHGKRLGELDGAYLYGDWVTGRIWGLKQVGGKLTWHRELVRSTLQIVCFGEDNADEVLVVDFGGGIYRLDPNPETGKESLFPRRLSETGLFQSVTRQEPMPGVVAFSIRAGMWADGATAERFVGIPGAETIVKTNEGKWRFPKDSVLAKTLSLETRPGNPASRRRLETQILHFDGLNWRGYSYRWNADQSDARLVEEAGAEESLRIRDASYPGGERQQTWRFGSRAECMRCHNPWAGPPLAFNALQLEGGNSQGGSAPGRASDPLRAFVQNGLLAESVIEKSGPQLINPRDAAAGIDERARSWLHVNCAHCHREGAGGSVISHFNYDLKLAEMKAAGERPSQGTFELPSARVVAPGHPLQSTLYYRLSTLGPSHMPRLGSSLIDDQGLKLIYDWIGQLPQTAGADPDFVAATREEQIGGATIEKLAREKLARAEERAIVDQLLATPSGALMALRELHAFPPMKSRAGKSIIAAGTVSKNPLVQSLFERFVPEERREKKLGSTIPVDKIVARRGDIGRGKKIFFQPGGPQCGQCHQINGEGREFGPDLSHIGVKFSRAQILDNILFPSKTIDPPYLTYRLETKGELSYTGFLSTRTAEMIVLRDVSGNEIRAASGDIKSFERLGVSAMPEGLLQGLTMGEASDLIEFLGSLR